VAPYWQALRRREFLLPYDTRRGRFLSPVESLADAAIEWRPAPRDGRIVSYSWIHLPADGYDDLPYVLATVEVSGGPQLMCNIVDAEPGEVRIGAPVRLVFEERSGGWVVPQFTPVR
jgi:uncharacterized OB-fold protein